MPSKKTTVLTSPWVAVILRDFVSPIVDGVLEVMWNLVMYFLGSSSNFNVSDFPNIPNVTYEKWFY